MSVIDQNQLLDLHDGSDTNETARRLAEAAKVAVEADAAGVLRHFRGGDTATASTDERVDRAQQLQVEHQEGPCYDALRNEAGDVIHVEDLLEEERWSQWTPRAIELGYRSVVSIAIRTPSHRIGSLNVYADRPHAFSGDDCDVTVLMAQHAARAMAANIDRETLTRAVDARQLIGVAIGILMARYGLDQEQSFSVLRRYSQDANIKLRTVAEGVVESGSIPGAGQH